jgi:hypothetical protein
MTERKPMTPKISLHLIEAMKVRPHSYDELVAISGLERPTVARFIKSTRDLKMVHLGAWAPDSRGYSTVQQFAYGDKPDVPRPVAKSAAERMAGTRARRAAA